MMVAERGEGSKSEASEYERIDFDGASADGDAEAESGARKYRTNRS